MADVIYAGDGGAFKDCTQCGKLKRISEFGQRKSAFSGLRSDCRECNRADANRWATENHERKKAANRANEERKRRAAGVPLAGRICSCIDCGSAFSKTAPAKVRCADCQGIADLENHRRANKKYEDSQPPRIRDKLEDKERRRVWAANNPEKVLASAKRSNDRRRSTPQGHLEWTMRAAVKRGIRKETKAGRRTFEILGYTRDELMVHIERQFQPGMSWDNYGEWHLDHRIPLAEFQYETPDCPDFKRAWALTNLQPLWKLDNLKKGAKRLYLV